MLENVEIYVILFTIYAVIGWIMEVLLSVIQHHKFINRGFLIGPYCPIYGFGGLLITLFLNNFMKTIYTMNFWDNIWISSIVIMFICGILEYFTSYIMEKLFHARWWDYHKYKFNINGRICLEMLIPFTILGQIILRYASPKFLELIGNFSQTGLHVTALLIILMYASDLLISYNIISSFKKLSNEVKDNTEEITRKVKEIISKSWRGRRLIAAFPNVDIDVIKEKIRIKLEESKQKIEKRKEEIIEKYNKKITK